MSNLLTVCLRVVAPGSSRTISANTFTNWGSHSDHHQCAYLTVAAAIGMTKDDVDLFLKRLGKVLLKFKHKKTDRQEETTEVKDNEL